MSTSKKTPVDERTELAWCQFCTPAWPQLAAYQGEAMIVSTDQRKLFLGEMAGIRVVFIELENAVSRAHVPLTNVASFGVK